MSDEANKKVSMIIKQLSTLEPDIYSVDKEKRNGALFVIGSLADRLARDIEQQLAPWNQERT